MVVAVPAASWGRFLVSILQEAGHDVLLVASATDVLTAVARGDAEAVLLAASLPPEELAAVCGALRIGPYAGPILILRAASVDAAHGSALGVADASPDEGDRYG